MNHILVLTLSLMAVHVCDARTPGAPLPASVDCATLKKVLDLDDIDELDADLEIAVIRTCLMGDNAEELNTAEKVKDCLQEAYDTNCQQSKAHQYKTSFDQKESVAREDDWIADWIHRCTIIKNGRATTQGQEALVGELKDKYCQYVNVADFDSTSEAVYQCYKDAGCPDADGLKDMCVELTTCIQGDCEKEVAIPYCNGVNSVDDIDDDDLKDCLSDVYMRYNCQYLDEYPTDAEVAEKYPPTEKQYFPIYTVQQMKRLALLKAAKMLLKM